MIKGKKYSLKEARSKILAYCAKRESSHQDVRRKLKEWQVNYGHIEELIAYLIENNFLNESRFACLYTRSKFNQKSWGWVKIRKELMTKNISEYCIKEAYLELDRDEYLARLEKKKKKKKNTYTGRPLEIKGKVFKYLVQKGYEYSLIMDKYKENYD